MLKTFHDASLEKHTLWLSFPGTVQRKGSLSVPLWTSELGAAGGAAGSRCGHTPG